MSKIFLVISLLSLNIESMQRLGSLSPFEHYKVEILAKLDRFSLCTIEKVCQISKEHAITLANAAVDCKISDKDKLMVIARSCSDACDILFPLIEHLIEPVGPGFDSEKESQSGIYLKSKFARLTLASRLSQYPDSRYATVLSHEAKLNQEGYYCSYHGQMSQFGFQQDLTRDLINELHDQGVISAKYREDFVPIQNMEGLIFQDSIHAQEIYEAAVKEQAEMSVGRDCRMEIIERPNRLAVNMFLAGNLMRVGSCTLEFLKYNFNVRKRRLNVAKDVFSKLHIPEYIFEDYEVDIVELSQKYKGIFESGRLLQICIPKEDVDKYVYLASPGAYKTEHKTIDGETVTTVSRFIE